MHEPAAEGPTDTGRPPPPGQLSTRTVYRNPWMTVREDTFRRHDGVDAIYGVVDKDDFAIVVPVVQVATVDVGGAGEVGGVGEVGEVGRSFHLVEQFRYPIGRRSWEFPMGTWPTGRSGTPLELARTELREETGLTAGAWRHLGHLHHAAGFCSQGFDVFLATELTSGDHDREESEADMVHALVSEREFLAMIDDGLIFDAATIAAYALLLRADAAGG